MVATVVVLAMVTGCSPQPPHPAPSPTPSPRFTSEADAYKAAEDTYRAYVDALNAVDISDPATFEDVYRWATEGRQSADKKTLTAYHAENVSMLGSTRILSLTATEATPPLDEVVLAACVDVSSVDIRSEDGASLVSPDRPDVQSVAVEVHGSDGSPTGFVVAAIGGRTEGPAC
ncbi:hypothetical protein [Microbacterium luticocti]|uniref:hypothetical protein n=1 Tax=Microbacterium luticocti TaxID=451764 RepID=UPI0012EBFFC9|nr:hypothetical protein [Microbacterium luticocti]